MAAHETFVAREDGYGLLGLRSVDELVEATFAPELGMLGTSLRCKSVEFLHRQWSLAAFASERCLQGIPFLHPWANRLSAFQYSARDRTVNLDSDDPHLLLDENGMPIHGLQVGVHPWEVIEHVAGDEAAVLRALCRWHPQRATFDRFPFAHDVEIVVRLQGRRLALATTVHGRDGAGVPISYGYHPYLALPGMPRERWHVRLPAGRRLELDEQLIPTGESRPWPGCSEALGATTFDDGFGSLDAGSRFAVRCNGLSITVALDEGFPFAQVYAPPGRAFICFEPMAAPGNALVSGQSLPWLPAGASSTSVWSIEVAVA